MRPLSLAAIAESEWFPIPRSARFAGLVVSTGFQVSLASPDSEFEILYWSPNVVPVGSVPAKLIHINEPEPCSVLDRTLTGDEIQPE